MKIAMVTPFYFPIIGGTESFVENVSYKLTQKGLKIDVITFNFRGPKNLQKNDSQQSFKIKRIPISCIPQSKLRSLLINVNYVPLNSLSFLNDYDIIHFNNDSDLSFPFFSLPIRKPKLLHCHNINQNFPYYRRNPLSSAVLKNVSNNYISVSNCGTSLLKQLGISQSRIIKLYNGVDTDIFKPAEVDNPKNMLLFVGRLDPNKGLHILLHALKLLKNPVELVIVGHLSWNEAYNSTIMSMIKSTSFNSIHKIVYLGEQKLSELLRLYQKTSLLILPSLHEPFGIVLIEAMACEKTVIASNTGGIPEIVHDYQNGLLFKPGNYVQLAREIEYLLENENLRKKLGKAGRLFVVKNFSYDTTIRRLLQIYHDAAKDQ